MPIMTAVDSWLPRDREVGPGLLGERSIGDGDGYMIY